MNDLDTALRDLYSGRADRAPSGADLLTVVHGRLRRERRTRMLGGVAAALALVLVGGLGVAVALRPEETRTLRVTDGRGAMPRPDPAPISVGWLPGGFREQRVQYLGPETWAIDSVRDDSTAVLTVEVSGVEPQSRPATRTVDVDGVAARLFWAPRQKTPEPFVELTYQREPGQWIKIMAVNPGTMRTIVTENEVVRIAENITDEAQAVVDVLRMASPEGLVPGWVTSNGWGPHVTFIDPGTRPTPLHLDDGPLSHVGRLPARLDVRIRRLDAGTTLQEAGIFSGTDGTVADLPPDGLFTEGTDRPGSRPGTDPSGKWATFVYPMPGNDDLVVFLDVHERGTPLSSEETLRALAKSVRPGPDAILGS